MAQAKKQTQPKKSRVEQVLSLIGEMTPAEREKIADKGIVIPLGTGESFVVKWGMRCRRCNRVAMEFFGEDPPFHLPVHQLSYRIPGYDPTKYDRRKPFCQHCGQGVAMLGQAVKQQYVIEIQDFQKSRADDEEMIRRANGRRSRFPEDEKHQLVAAALAHNVDLRDEVPHSALTMPGRQSHLEALTRVSNENPLGKTYRD